MRFQPWGDEMAEQDLFSTLVITVINMVFLAVFIKWLLPDLVKTLKEAKNI